MYFSYREKCLGQGGELNPILKASGWQLSLCLLDCSHAHTKLSNGDPGRKNNRRSPVILYICPRILRSFQTKVTNYLQSVVVA